MGSMMRRLRRGTGWQVPARRVAFDFETDSHYGYRKGLEGRWWQSPDLVFRDETDRIMDHDLMLPLAYGCGDFAHMERTILAIDPGSSEGDETGIVYFKGGKVVR